MTIDHEKLDQLASLCAKCGACTAVCPVYQVTGRESLSARGKIHLLSRHVPPASTTYGTIFSSCLLCGACRAACPRKIDTISLIAGAREKLPFQVQHQFWKKLLLTKTLASPGLLQGASRLRRNLLQKIPQSSGLWHKLALLPEEYGRQNQLAPLPPDTTGSSPSAISYFSGCLARYVSTDISTATRFLVQQATDKDTLTPQGQACCGLASYASGNSEEAKKLAKKNIEAFSSHSLPILTSCASCFSHLRSYPRLLADDPSWSQKACEFAARVVEFSQFFKDHPLAFPLQAPMEGAPGSRIFYHDPCHLRFGPDKSIDAPRDLITKATGTPPVSPASGPRCCGQGGLFQLAHPQLSSMIFTPLLQEIMELSVSHVVTSCSGCLLQWQKGLSTTASAPQVSHLAVMLAGLMLQHKK